MKKIVRIHRDKLLDEKGEVLANLRLRVCISFVWYFLCFVFIVISLVLVYNTQSNSALTPKSD